MHSLFNFVSIKNCFIHSRSNSQSKPACSTQVTVSRGEQLWELTQALLWFTMMSSLLSMFTTTRSFPPFFRPPGGWAVIPARTSKATSWQSAAWAASSTSGTSTQWTLSSPRSGWRQDRHAEESGEQRRPDAVVYLALPSAISCIKNEGDIYYCNF